MGLDPHSTYVVLAPQLLPYHVLAMHRCGPMDVALNIMVKHASVRQLLTAMVTKVFPLAEAEAAVAMAQTRGVLKVQLEC